MNLALLFRGAVARAADDSAASRYSLIAEWENLDTNVVIPYSLADAFNRYPDDPLPARRLSSVAVAGGAEEGEQAVVEGEKDSTRVSRALPSSLGVKVTMWFMYGHDFARVGDSKDVDAGVLAATIVTGLQSPATWSDFIAQGGGTALGLTAAELAQTVDPNSVHVTLPRLRYRPTAFGELEGTTVGSLIGIAVSSARCK
jgi:hypothetical protein